MAAFNPEVNEMNNELVVNIDEQRQIRCRERYIDVHLENIQEYPSNAPIYLNNVRKIYKACKDGYQRLSRKVGNLLQEQEKYGQQEWGMHDELLLKIEILQKELSEKETENCSLREQNRSLQQKVASLENDQQLSMIRERQASMDSIGRVLSSMRISQEYIRVCEDPGVSGNLDIR